MMAMPNCGKCDSYVDLEDAFCTGCGTLLRPDTEDTLRAIAFGQRRIIWCLLGELFVFAYVFVLGGVVGAMFEGTAYEEVALQTITIPAQVGYVLVKILQVVVTWKLCRTLGMPGPYAIGTLLGCLGLFVLLGVSHASTKRLKAGGIRVGLMGAVMSDVPGLKPLL